MASIAESQTEQQPSTSKSTRRTRNTTCLSSNKNVKTITDPSPPEVPEPPAATEVEEISEPVVKVTKVRKLRESKSKKKCRGPDSYSVVSIPFLAGGELEFPNVIDAIIQGGANILRSVRNWRESNESCNDASTSSSYTPDPDPELDQNSDPAPPLAPPPLPPPPPLTTPLPPSSPPHLAVRTLKPCRKKPQQQLKGNNSVGFASKDDVAMKSMETQTRIEPEIAKRDVAAVMEPSKKVPGLKEAKKRSGSSPLSNVSFNKTPSVGSLAGTERPVTPVKTVSIESLQIHARRSTRKSDQSKKSDHTTEAIQVNLPLIKTESARVIENNPKGLTGLKNMCQARANRAEPRGVCEKDFLDLFMEKDCVRFITYLEQMEHDFLPRVAAIVAKTETQSEGSSKEEMIALLDRIQALSRITPTEEEKELQDYDFPKVLEYDTHKFSVDVRRKIEVVQKIHTFGVKTVLSWIALLHEEAHIPPREVYCIATDLLASTMVTSYSIFARVGEHFASLASESRASASIISDPPFDKTIHHLQNLIDTIADEIGAIGESSAQILIRIPGATKVEIEDTLKELYVQVNYAELALSRAVEALEPAIQCYALHQLFKRKQKPAPTNNKLKQLIINQLK